MASADSSAPPLRLIICGREKAFAAQLGEHLREDGFLLTHTFDSLELATTNLPGLVADAATRPRVIVVGRGFSDEDQNAMVGCAKTKHGDGGPGVAWLLANNKHISLGLVDRIGVNDETRSGPPPAHIIVGRIRECLRDVGIYRGGPKEQGIERDEVFGF